ncbi:hypothetical protein CRG98_038700 [Punica granatum]|uniref:Uncharacterized protein n=1 Tax=Punica granatum TaxID=22663 RepID=A0A2I0IA88_PUNGR|nr:hypothetical protein CRG98_038700 [Punica granatum]
MQVVLMKKKPWRGGGHEVSRLVMGSSWVPRALREIRDKVQVWIDSVFESSLRIWLSVEEYACSAARESFEVSA